MSRSDGRNRLVEAFTPLIDRLLRNTDERIERAVAPLSERIERLEHRIAELECGSAEASGLPEVVPDTALQEKLDAAGEGSN